MWLENRFQLCPTSERTLVLYGGEDFGAPFLVERLKRELPVAWMTVGPSEAGDPIALGNKLAEAVNEALSGNLLQHALPYGVHLRTLSMRRNQLLPFVLVISNADLAPEFAEMAARACRSDLGVWLLVGAGFDIKGSVRVGTEELRLSLGEARALSPHGLSDESVAALHSSTRGAYTSFLTEVYRCAGLPEMLIPLAGEWVYPESEARHEAPEDVVEALTRLGRWIDALEVATEHVPERVEELLHFAGPEFQQQGLLARLHVLLSLLPDAFVNRERTLEWRLVAARQVGADTELLPAIRSYLLSNESPELRARYAPLAPFKEALGEARRAVEFLPTPLTLWQYGRMHPDPQEGIEFLTRSVSQAELEGDMYACARAAGNLATRFRHIGDFHSSRTWAAWGMQIFDENGLKDGIRRLSLYDELASSRVLLGDTAGLLEQVHDYHTTVENFLPGVAANLRSLLANLERLAGDPVLAAEYTLANLSTASRSQKGLRAYEHVRSLLELGNIEEAEVVATEAVALSAGTAQVQDLRAQLALGMVQSFSDPAAAGTLLNVMKAELEFEQPAMAALHYLLAKPDGIDDIPAALLAKLKGLSETALRVLSGPPDAFHRVWKLLGAEGGSVLELKVLGRTSARLEGSEVELTKRQWEILVALALHPEGLDYESLHAFLLHDSDQMSPGTLRSHVSYLRSRVPISDNPYRIEVPYTIDVRQVEERLTEGKVREAVAMASGTVLPRSTLPGIREVGTHLDQALRESVLSSGDAEVLYSATGLWPDDLEVWEASLTALHGRDPRVPLIRARVQSLQREYGAA